MENIKKRTSVRTFDKKEISEETMEKLAEFIKDIEENHDNYRFPIFHSNIDGKVGTYGVITGGNTYISGVLKSHDADLVLLGYLFEKIIIFATSLELGTCWLGGTFNKSDFIEKSRLNEGEKFICASPIGYPTENKSIRDRAMRKLAKSDHRKDFNELFFSKDLKPLNKEEIGIYKKALEMVRIGPSASNKQPWRIVKEEDKYHLYLERTPDYAKPLDYDIQLLDMGIAKYHFEATLKENNVDGNWFDLEDYPKYDNFEYISTWI